MGEWIDFRDLRSKLSFQTVLEKYSVRLHLRAAGKQAVASCPLPNHSGERKKQSFSANLEKGIFRCFSCEAKGNLLDFACLMENRDPQNGNELSAVAGIRWAVNMGRLWNGNTVGMIRLNELSLSSNIYTTNVLSFTQRSTNVTELDVVPTNGPLRQIRAPQALSDIQSTNGECTLKFYTLVNVASTKTNGLYGILTNTPFVTWRIKNPDTNSSTRLQLIEERPGRTNTSQLSYNSTNKVWTLTRGSGTETITEARTIAFTNSNRIETTDISQNATSAYHAIETYHPYPSQLSISTNWTFTALNQLSSETVAAGAHQENGHGNDK